MICEGARAQRLFSYCTLEEDNGHVQLYQFLWRTPALSLPAASTAFEPLALKECIDVWEGNTEGMDVMDVVDEYNSEPSPRPGPPQLRFIDLDKHPEMRVHSLIEPHPPTIVVREEYHDFMTHALQSEEGHRRFFLTGQPGIGNDLVVRAAVESSWVLIDVDFGGSVLAEDWYPGSWVRPCAGLVWTSSPRRERLRKFISRFSAKVWYMKAWVREEIALVTIRENKDAAEIQARLCLSGPVARTLFADEKRASTDEIDLVIADSFKVGLFDTVVSHIVSGTDEKASHQMFLLGPKEFWDEDGVPQLDRSEPAAIFLSIHIAARTPELVVQAEDELRKRLASTFNSSATCGAAGELVEGILHQELCRGSVDPFGVGGHGLSILTLIGQTTDFIFESHGMLPLYLRPKSRYFAVDSIVVTDTMIWLVQSTMSDRHSFKTLLSILLRLEQQGINIDGARLVYCLIGTNGWRVGTVARLVAQKLVALKATTTANREQELGQNAKIVDRLLLKFDVEGYSFANLKELKRVWPE
ncbi:hypothetical protein GGX14DRAFT_394108 [Mycena pura]|uniref:Uncharacterized protein n=1 Tax=Mycena pura TaxID=153505 RepID=A0AAD6VIP0_9AGAR|nr:hypothetical protein GGX14DRAFT_394108 [Mycena pura]